MRLGVVGVDLQGFLVLGKGLVEASAANQGCSRYCCRRRQDPDRFPGPFDNRSMASSNCPRLLRTSAAIVMGLGVIGFDLQGFLVMD